MTKLKTAAAASPLIALAVCAFAIFLMSVMDAAMKGLVIAVGVYNTILWRSVAVTVAAGGAWSLLRPAAPKAAALKLHALRAVVIGITLISFFWGLAKLPLAEAIALSFIAPLIALFFAALLLGERVRKQAIWGSLAGMGGVVIIMAGQFGHSTYTSDALAGTAAVLFSTVFYAFNLVLMRRQALIAPPLEISFFQNLILVIILAFGAPWVAVAPSSDLWLPIAGVAALSFGGNLMMNWAYARAEAQYLIPMEYTAFVWAIGLGWFLFGEVVSWTTLSGAGLIIAGCIVAARTNPKLAEPIEVTV